MKIDAGLHGGLAHAGAVAQQLEASGFDGLQTAEVAHDPFLPLVLAAERTERIQLMTGIAVAFARNPMLLANVGWDLHEYSGGRFVLGLGSQIKPHITKRFSMPWSRPAARMQEMIEAIRAIWACWNDGEKLDHRGEFYSHTLMTPMFTPGVNPHGNPPIHLAAVGPMMTRVAGRVADGFVSHAFQTADYLRDVTVPALEEGLADAGRSRTEVEISMPLFVVSGTTEEEFDDRKRATKGQIAFYGSTPAYKGVLEHHGWDDVQPELNRLSKQGRWVEMGDVIDDEILSTFAVVGEQHEVPELIRDRFGGLVDRISIGAYAGDATAWESMIDEIRAI